MYWTFDNKYILEISYQSPYTWNSQKHKNPKYFLFCCGIEFWCVNSPGHPDLLWSGCVEPESKKTIEYVPASDYERVPWHRGSLSSESSI